MKDFHYKDPKSLITLFVVLFILITIPLTVYTVLTQRDDRSKAAGSTTMTLTPATGSFNVNSDVVVLVRENSGTVPVVLAEVTLTYDRTRLDFQSMDNQSTADFKFQLPGTGADENTGTITINRMVEQPTCDGCPPVQITGDKLIATLRFKSLTVAGSAAINYSTTSKVYKLPPADRNPDETDNTTGTRTGATYTIVDALPSVTLNVPAANAHVRGNAVALSASATDNLGVTKVEFYDGANKIGEDLAPDTGTNNYTFNWNTTTVTSGVHSLTARAFDANGSQPSAAVSVTVDNNAPTVTLPSFPTNQRGTLTVTATASDGILLDRVEFRLNGGAVTPDTTNPYQYNFITTGVADGAHTITAIAYDRAGNPSTQASTSITVDNTGPTAAVLSGSATSQTTVNLSWTASTDVRSGPVRYDIYQNGNKITTTPLPASTTSQTVSGLTAGTQYNFMIVSLDSINNPTNSNILPITTPAPFKFGDLDRDGKVGSLDLLYLVSKWGTNDSIADLDPNGIVNSLDLLRLVSAWGT